VSRAAALVWSVPAPRGGRRYYLSTHQRVLLSWLVTHPNGRGTAAQLAALTGDPSRGNLHNNLARLRQLGLIGYTAVRGRLGYVRWWAWFSSAAHRLGIATAAVRRRVLSGINVSTPPSGMYCSRSRYASAAWTGGYPPGSPGIGGLAGPQRGRRPPRILYGRCANGHQVRTGRWSHGWDPRTGIVSAVYLGGCQRCGLPVRDELSLRLPHPVYVTYSGDGLEPDPATTARRRLVAARIARDFPELAGVAGRYLAAEESRPEPAAAGP
jgi:hypothetical protein